MDPGGYTGTEKQWLKKNWGSEFKFLQAYGLKIYNDEDREEGRAIVRAFMEHDEPKPNESQAAGQPDAVRDTLWSVIHAPLRTAQQKPR